MFQVPGSGFVFRFGWRFWRNLEHELGTRNPELGTARISVVCLIF